MMKKREEAKRRREEVPATLSTKRARRGMFIAVDSLRVVIRYGTQIKTRKKKWRTERRTWQ